MHKAQEKETIAFHKPNDFTPVFTAKVLNHKQRLLMPLSMMILTCFLSCLYLFNADYFEATIGLGLTCLFYIFALPALRIHQNATLIEISRTGIWLPVYKLYIPHALFAEITSIWQTHHSADTLEPNMRTRHITLGIHLSAEHLRTLRRRPEFLFSGQKHKTQMQTVHIKLPFSSGKSENIGLNLQRAELFQTINDFKKGEGLFAPDSSS